MSISLTPLRDYLQKKKKDGLTLFGTWTLENIIGSIACDCSLLGSITEIKALLTTDGEMCMCMSMYILFLSLREWRRVSCWSYFQWWFGQQEGFR